jgi:hypothetical protein
MPATVYLVVPVSDAAKEWLDVHIDEDATWHGNGVAVEHRYIEDILLGMVADGLVRGVDYKVVS